MKFFGSNDVADIIDGDDVTANVPIFMIKLFGELTTSNRLPRRTILFKRDRCHMKILSLGTSYKGKDSTMDNFCQKEEMKQGKKDLRGFSGMPDGMQRMPGGIQRMPGGIQKMPGGVQRMPGVFQGISDGVPGMPGGVPRMPTGVRIMKGGVPGKRGRTAWRPQGFLGSPSGVTGKPGTVQGRMVSTIQPGLDSSCEVTSGGESVSMRGPGNMGQYIFSGDSGLKNNGIFSNSKLVTGLASRRPGVTSLLPSRRGSYGVNGGLNFTSRGSCMKGG